MIKDIPWHLVIQSGYAARRIGFTTGSSSHHQLEIDGSVDEIKTDLIKHHLNPGWLFSYNYEGEDANLRRAELRGDKAKEIIDYDPEWLSELGYSSEDYQSVLEELNSNDYESYQLHIRLFDEGDKTIAKPHHELDTIAHPKLHIKEVNFNYELGMVLMSHILRIEGYGYKRVK